MHGFPSLPKTPTQFASYYNEKYITYHHIHTNQHVLTVLQNYNSVQLYYVHTPTLSYFVPQFVPLNPTGVETYIRMLLLDNFVHTDLHPGNILIRTSADTAPNIPQITPLPSTLTTQNNTNNTAIHS